MAKLDANLQRAVKVQARVGLRAGAYSDEDKIEEELASGDFCVLGRHEDEKVGEREQGSYGCNRTKQRGRTSWKRCSLCLGSW